MATVERAVPTSSKPDFRDPQLREWRARLARPAVSASIEVTPDETGFGMPPREIHVEFVEGGIALPVESNLWSHELNAGLVELGVRAVHPANEAVRFSIGLSLAFNEAECAFGGGYFSSVLFEFLSDGATATDPEIAAALPHCYAVSLRKDGDYLKPYLRCRRMIGDAIEGREHELVEKLGYSPDESKGILLSAISRYLDQRFNISKRRRMGLI